jgi:hypothetical protein
LAWIGGLVGGIRHLDPSVEFWRKDQVGLCCGELVKIHLKDSVYESDSTFGNGADGNGSPTRSTPVKFDVKVYGTFDGVTDGVSQSATIAKLIRSPSGWCRHIPESKTCHQSDSEPRSRFP